MFTKKLFSIIASIIKNINLEAEVKNQLINAFIVEFSKQNPRFKSDYFRKACGGE